LIAFFKLSNKPMSSVIVVAQLSLLTLSSEALESLFLSKIIRLLMLY